MSWLACSRTSFHLLNSTRRQFSFSFRSRFPRDLSVPPRLRNAHIQSRAVPSFQEQVARTNPVPCFADAVRHPQMGKHIIVRRADIHVTRLRDGTPPPPAPFSKFSFFFNLFFGV